MLGKRGKQVMDEPKVHLFPRGVLPIHPFLFPQKGETMDKRLRDIIHTIDYYELLKIKKDLQDGGIHLKKFVEDEIKKRQVHHHITCSTCGIDIDPKSTVTTTLIFGPDDFKKKATFCGKDCLQYFIQSMDEMKKGYAPKTTIPK
jgi:hypothetical protein